MQFPNIFDEFLEWVCVEVLAIPSSQLFGNVYIHITWSHTLREECRLRVIKNRILRRVFGPKRDDIEEWRRLRDEELQSLSHSPNIARVIKSRRWGWAGHAARMEEGRSALIILPVKPIGKRPLGRPRHRWEDNIRMDLKEIGELG